MIQLKISDKNWVSIKDVEFEMCIPYWCKTEKGDIVMAAFYSNDSSTGMAECFVDDGGLKINGNSFYILKNAMVQPVIFK